ncbi:MAG: MBL fold metallo-hydrolase [Oscillospiraceae bacterium]|nr:MBL fold metallo-hydrolase [Oscillospiraceae bacterium]
MHSSITQYIFDHAGSNMYILTENEEALVIDPHVCTDALSQLEKANVKHVTVLLTHEHYDHTSGLTWLCSIFKSTVICHEQTAVSLKNGKNSRPLVVAASRMNKYSPEELKAVMRTLPQGYRYNADITFSDEYKLVWNGHNIRMISCAGHSKGSCCIELDDDTVATGDSLILNEPVITRFVGGSEKEYKTITLPYLNSISDATLILPGHGKTFYMRDARSSQQLKSV